MNNVFKVILIYMDRFINTTEMTKKQICSYFKIVWSITYFTVALYGHRGASRHVKVTTQATTLDDYITLGSHRPLSSLLFSTSTLSQAVYCQHDRSGQFTRHTTLIVLLKRPSPSPTSPTSSVYLLLH